MAYGEGGTVASGADGRDTPGTRDMIPEGVGSTRADMSEGVGSRPRRGWGRTRTDGGLGRGHGGIMAERGENEVY